MMLLREDFTLMTMTTERASESIFLAQPRRQQ
jgi:hypothetical protein